MTASQARIFASLSLVIGTSILGYLLWQVPPRQSGGQIDLLAVLLCFVGLFLFCTGIGAWSAIQLHQRWPMLSGAKVLESPAGQTMPQPMGAAFRQGLFFSIAICLIALFAMLHILDSIFVFVIFLLVGLAEAYFQNNRTS